MLIQFTLQDLVFVLAWIIGLAIGVLLILTLWKIIKVVGNLQSLLQTNQENINKTVKTMPGIFENVEQISSNVRETTDKLNVSVPMILEDVEGVTNVAKESFDLIGAVIENLGSGGSRSKGARKSGSSGFMDYIHIIVEVVQIIVRIFKK